MSEDEVVVAITIEVSGDDSGALHSIHGKLLQAQLGELRLTRSERGQEEDGTQDSEELHESRSMEDRSTPESARARGRRQRTRGFLGIAA